MKTALTSKWTGPHVEYNDEVNLIVVQPEMEVLSKSYLRGPPDMMSTLEGEGLMEKQT